MQLAVECGAKRVLIPSENKRDLADVPDSVLNKLQVSFYTDPMNAAIGRWGWGKTKGVWPEVPPVWLEDEENGNSKTCA